jgi:hypothetical protein
MGSILAVLEAARRRRPVAEAFRGTLAGLPGVHVEVEPINTDAEQDGLAAADVRADVESVLRDGGLAVHALPRLFADVPGTPVLHVDVTTLRLDARYAYSVRLELWQAVRLVRDPALAGLALTWSAPQLVGSVAAERLGELRRTVRGAAQGFLEACRLATASHR